MLYKQKNVCIFAELFFQKTGDMKKNLFIVGILLLMLTTSCELTKKVPYMQNIDEVTQEAMATIPDVPEQVIRPGDLIDITIMATDRSSVQPFNRRVVDVLNNRGSYSTNVEELNYYLVDNSGYIDMPVLGRIFVQGMTKSQLESTVRDMIYPKYITESPSVTVRFENFRISVLGDVVRPGSYTIPNERVNVLEALALAGDLTITGRRDNVLLVRIKSDGSRITARINLNDKNLLLSPYFYLQQNDVLYVEPNHSRAASAYSVPPTASIAISATSVALSAASLIMTILNFTK